MTLPASIRINAQFPFPSLVSSSGPITITKSNGIWTVGLQINNLAPVPNGTPASQLEVMVYNVSTQTLQQTLVSSLPTSYIFTVSTAPASASAQTVVLGTLSGAPALTNTGQTLLYNTAAAGAVLQGDGSLFDACFVNKNASIALAVVAGTTSLNYFGSLLGVAAASQLGFAIGAGAGGAVTQITSRTTGVTLNNSTGAITLFSAAGSATAATFTVTNSQVAATDVINVCQKSGTNLYNTIVTAVASGSFNITFYTTGGVATDAPVFNFVVIKGAAN
jgi:hypothetical protein